jgi:hypothetical protein
VKESKMIRSYPWISIKTFAKQLFYYLLIVFLLISPTSVLSGGFEPISVMCEVNGHLIPAIIDTGAEITVMSAACAKRCGLSSRIDTQHCGKAIGVGSSEIIGGVDGLPLRIGPLSFQNRVSILSSSRCDFLIGLDILKRFKCDISLREKILRMHVRSEEVRISLSSRPTDIFQEKETYSSNEFPTVHSSSSSKIRPNPLTNMRGLTNMYNRGGKRATYEIKEDNHQTDDHIDSDEYDEDEDMDYDDQTVSMEGV